MRRAHGASWAARLARHGHTGWSHPGIYAYDQLERLRGVDDALTRLGISEGRALDFGCGTGDFSSLMAARGLSVVAHDPFVTPRAMPGVEFCGDVSALMRTPHAFDLMLSVTVLDHLLDDADFEGMLRSLRTLAADGGRLVLLEYALDAPPPTKPAHQAMRTLARWRAALAACGWELGDVRPFPCPGRSPSAGFTAYRKSIRARVLARMVRYGVARDLAQRALSELARETFARHGVGSVASSELKLMVCEAAQ